MYKLLILSFMLIANYSFGSIKKIEARLDNKKRLLKTNKAKVAKIKRAINTIDSQINDVNAKFSKIIDLKRVLNREIHDSKLNSKKTRRDLEADLKGLKKIIAGLYLIDGTEEEVEYRFLLLEKLKDKKMKMTGLDNSLKRIEKELLDLQNRLSDYEFLESDLVKNLEQLTSGKKNHKKNLVKYLNDVRQVKKDVKVLSKKRKRIALEVKRDFILPVKSYSKINTDKTGSLSLLVEKDENVLAPKGGRIAYAGKLSTYGNVIVIRHRPNLRSVLLGKFLIAVEKGDEVKKGQVLGQVLDNENENKLYFEVRKNNKKIFVKNVVSEYNTI